MKRIIILLSVMLLLSACSKEEPIEEGQEAASGNATNEVAMDNTKLQEGYSFDINDVRIPMNVDAASIVAELGDPVEYFEAASCAFQGLDKIYYYNGFELGTYPNGDRDFVSYVNLLDDSVSTDKGVYLGVTLEEVTAAYGNDYTVEGTSYVYQLGVTKLTFIVEENVVTSITYYAIVEGLNN